MLDFAFEGRNQLTVLREDRQIEVIMIVCYQYFAYGVDSYPDRVIGDPFSTDLSKIGTLVIEHLHAVGAIVANEDLLFVVHDYSIRKF